jgi:hypothetical protein
VCHGIVEMLLTKATILDQLGRKREAEEVRRMADRESRPHMQIPPGEMFRNGVPRAVYYDWLKQIRLGLE